MDALRNLAKQLVLLTWLLCLPLLATAQSPTDKELQVGITNTPPFSMLTKNSYDGIAVLIWEKIALQNHWHYHYVVVGTDVDKDLEQLRNGTLDVLVEPVEVTHPRIEKIEFSRPFMLQVFGTVTRHEANYIGVFRSFLGSALLAISAVSAFCFLVYINLMWFFERGTRPTIPRNYVKGISYLVWLTLLGADHDKMPKTVYGRITLFGWIVLISLFFSSFTASITSALTTALNAPRILTLSDLRGMSIACISGQTPIDDSWDAGLSVTYTATMEQAMQLLREKKVDVIVARLMPATYYINMHPEKQKYTVEPLENEGYEVGFALPLNSPLRHKIDLSLSELRDTNTVINICAKYVGGRDAKFCNI